MYVQGVLGGERHNSGFLNEVTHAFTPLFVVGAQPRPLASSRALRYKFIPRMVLQVLSNVSMTLTTSHIGGRRDGHWPVQMHLNVYHEWEWHPALHCMCTHFIYTN